MVLKKLIHNTSFPGIFFFLRKKLIDILLQKDRILFFFHEILKELGGIIVVPVINALSLYSILSFLYPSLWCWHWDSAHSISALPASLALWFTNTGSGGRMWSERREKTCVFLKGFLPAFGSCEYHPSNTSLSQQKRFFPVAVAETSLQFLQHLQIRLISPPPAESTMSQSALPLWKSDFQLHGVLLLSC